MFCKFENLGNAAYFQSVQSHLIAIRKDMNDLNTNFLDYMHALTNTEQEDTTQDLELIRMQVQAMAELAQKSNSRLLQRHWSIKKRLSTPIYRVGSRFLYDYANLLTFLFCFPQWNHPEDTVQHCQNTNDTASIANICNRKLIADRSAQPCSAANPQIKNTREQGHCNC